MSPAKPFSISRTVDAPRSLVYLVQTDPLHLAKWFGPAGSKVIKADMDLRPGGTYHYGLLTAHGQEMWGKQEFLEVVPNEKLVLLQSFSDRDGGLVRHPFAPTWPLRLHATTTFEDAPEGRTKITVSWLPHEADETAIATFEAARDGMAGGFNGTFDALEAYLASTATQLLVSRHFAAPRELLWKLFTESAHVNVWWGPTGYRNEVLEQDVRVGGTWKFYMHGPGGLTFPNKATYVELAPPERIVYDLGDFDRVHFRSTIAFAEENGGTRVSLFLQFPDRSQRDRVIPFDAIGGGQQTLGKLAAYLAAHPTA